MSKKYFIFVNIIFAVIFAFKLFSLHARIWSEEEKPPDAFGYNFTEVKRPSIKKAAGFRNIFGVDMALSENKKENAEQNIVPEDLNELVLKDEIIRLRGIFITNDNRYAVISIAKKKKKKKEEMIKAGIGDKIRGFTVDSILPESVYLTGSKQNAIYLRIFKNDDI